MVLLAAGEGGALPSSRLSAPPHVGFVMVGVRVSGSSEGTDLDSETREVGRKFAPI